MAMILFPEQQQQQQQQQQQKQQQQQFMRMMPRLTEGYLDSRWSCSAVQRARTVATDAKKGAKDIRMKQDTSKSSWNTDAKLEGVVKNLRPKKYKGHRQGI